MAQDFTKTDPLPSPCGMTPTFQPSATGEAETSGTVAEIKKVATGIIEKAAGVLGFLGEDDSEGVELSPTDRRRLVVMLAEENGIEPEAALAFLDIESGGSAFCNDGKLKIRFEPHVFCGSTITGQNYAKKIGFDYTKVPWYDKSGNTAKAKWKELGYKHGSSCGSQHNEWKALEAAISINELQAYVSTSFGIAQIMGYNYPIYGYANPKEMFEDFAKSEEQQIKAFFVYMQKRSRGAIIKALKTLDFTEAARLYNGDGEINKTYNGKHFTKKRFYYGEKLRVLYEKYKKEGINV